MNRFLVGLVGIVVLAIFQIAPARAAWTPCDAQITGGTPTNNGRTSAGDAVSGHGATNPYGGSYSTTIFCNTYCSNSSGSAPICFSVKYVANGSGSKRVVTDGSLVLHYITHGCSNSGGGGTAGATAYGSTSITCSTTTLSQSIGTLPCQYFVCKTCEICPCCFPCDAWQEWRPLLSGSSKTLTWHTSSGTNGKTHCNGSVYANSIASISFNAIVCP